MFDAILSVFNGLKFTLQLSKKFRFILAFNRGFVKFDEAGMIYTLINDIFLQNLRVTNINALQISNLQRLHTKTLCSIGRSNYKQLNENITKLNHLQIRFFIFEQLQSHILEKDPLPIYAVVAAVNKNIPLNHKSFQIRREQIHLELGSVF